MLKLNQIWGIGELLSKEDKVYLNDKDYNMPLEKFFAPEIYAEGDRVACNGTVVRAYPFSNENLSKMFKYIPNNLNRVLTVGSSGDQFLNAVYYGAKDITVLDGNLFAKPYIDYKVAAIKNLTFEEFKYYFITKNDPFCRAVYSKLFQDLPEDSQVFFGTIFMDQRNSQDTYNAICNDDYIDEFQVYSDFYVKPECYARLKERLLDDDYKLEVINAEFSDFNKHFDGKYDLVMFSNVYQYISLRKFGKVALPLCANHLTDNGVVQLHYDFGYSLVPCNVKFQKWLKDKVSNIELGYGDTTYLLSKGNLAMPDEDYSNEVIMERES